MSGDLRTCDGRHMVRAITRAGFGCRLQDSRFHTARSFFPVICDGGELRA